MSRPELSLDEIQGSLERANQQLADIRQTIAKLSEQRRGGKDRWDKASVVAQFLSGAVIAIIGLIISYYVSHAQQDITKRQQFSDYLKLIVDANKDDERRATLITSLDLAVPDHAFRIAAYYVFVDKAPKVREAAIELLGKFAEVGPWRREAVEVLDRVVSGEVLPDRQLATVALKLPAVKEALVRISDIDDLGRLFVNGTKITEVRFANDSGWVDITPHLKFGENLVDFFLDNGPAGGWSGRLQVSAGAHQYDSTTLARDACPCNAPVFHIKVGVVVAEDRTIKKLVPRNVEYF